MPSPRSTRSRYLCQPLFLFLTTQIPIFLSSSVFDLIYSLPLCLSLYLSLALLPRFLFSRLTLFSDRPSDGFARQSGQDSGAGLRTFLPFVASLEPSSKTTRSFRSPERGKFRARVSCCCLDLISPERDCAHAGARGDGGEGPRQLHPRRQPPVVAPPRRRTLSRERDRERGEIVERRDRCTRQIRTLHTRTRHKRDREIEVTQCANSSALSSVRQISETGTRTSRSGTVDRAAQQQLQKTRLPYTVRVLKGHTEVPSRFSQLLLLFLFFWGC